MGKFGKKKEIDLNPLSYNIGLLGQSGVGKSTLMKEVCEKLAGEDGYIALDIGKEDGHDAINGIVTEKVEDWQKFEEICDDIIENKTADYKNLKIIIIDTYDEFCNIAEKEVVRQWNRKNPEKKAETINAVLGGFGRGLDKVIETMLEPLWELKKVGVAFAVIGHTKQKDVEDVKSEEKCSLLTANVSQKYFNAIKTKLHFCGLAYIDRDIVQRETSKKDNKGKTIVKGKVAGESRVINFRDDTYSVDSKSRFAEITPQIPMDADAFIKAMEDAIKSEQAKSGKSLADAKKKQKKDEDKKAKVAAKYSKAKKEAHVDIEENEKLVSVITANFKKADESTKEKIVDMLHGAGVDNFKDPDIIPTKILKEMVTLLES